MDIRFVVVQLLRSLLENFYRLIETEMWNKAEEWMGWKVCLVSPYMLMFMRYASGLLCLINRLSALFEAGF